MKLQIWRPVIFHNLNFSSATRGHFWNVTALFISTDHWSKKVRSDLDTLVVCHLFVPCLDFGLHSFIPLVQEIYSIFWQALKVEDLKLRKWAPVSFFHCTNSSCVSGRGHRIGAVFLSVRLSVCLSVCRSVCEHSHGQTIWPMTLLFGMGVELDLT